MTSAAQKVLEAKAKICQAQATEIPESPLYHMVKNGLGVGGNEGQKKSVNILQSTIDYLTCKAEPKLPFNRDEKEFLVELYKGFAIGGRMRGMPEAAKLARHYVRNTGTPVSVSEKPYTGSVIVKETMAAMKAYIKVLDAGRQPFHTLRTDDPQFRKSKEFRSLMLIRGNRNKNTQGYVKSTGVVHAEQNNERLQKADNRFLIKAMTRRTQHGFTTVWSINNTYDFEPFAKSNKITNIPLNPPLLLPDGLSEYMASGLKIAKTFKYAAKWTEFW